MGRRARTGKQERQEAFENSPAPQKIGEATRRVAAVEAPGWVTPVRHAENGVDSRALASHRTDESKRAVTGDHAKINTFNESHLQPNSATGAVVASAASDDSRRAIGQDHVKDSLRNAAQSTASMRTIGSLLGGGAVSAASSNHSHSVSYKLLARAARRGLLVLRGRIRGGRERELEERVRDLEGMVLALCHLAFDDEHEAAEERERRMVEDPEYRRAWSERVRLDFGEGSQGGSYVSPGLADYFGRIKASALLPGLYHFLDSTASGRAQAEHFLRRVEALGGPDGMLLAADFEHYGDRSPSNRHLADFVAEVKRRTRHPLIVYTAASFWNSGDPSGAFSKYGGDALWAAHYADMARHDRSQDYFRSLEGWGWDTIGGKRADIHQFTSAGLVAGQYIDVNATDLGTRGLVALADAPAAPNPKPEPDEEEAVPDEVPTWKKNWEVARTYGRNCAAASILYWFWDGGMLNRSVAGRPASVDGPAPRIPEIRRGFCADLLSWMQRRCGLPIPKNRGAGWNYDGGTQVYWLKYRGAMVPFRLSEMRDGDVAFRRFVDGEDEGHIMVSDEGMALQSFARDNLGNPGPDRSYTVAQSHDGGYYQYRIPREKFWA